MEKKRKIKKYIHAIQGGTVCNFKCTYCYVPDLQKGKNRTPIKFDYPLEIMLEALSPEHIGGLAFINYVGGGETFLSEETFPIIEGLLQQGHCLNVVTNATITSEIEKLCKLDNELKDHLMICASLHYLELKRLNLTDTYFENLNKLKKAGISFYMQLTICEEYMPFLQDIKDICLEKVNIEPSISIACDASKNWAKCSFYNEETYQKINAVFDTEDLDLLNELVYDKKRNEFCYAGEWSFVLNMENGNTVSCFAGHNIGNIFKNPKKKIIYTPIINCPSDYCGCGALLLGCGVIPELNFPTFSKFIEKKCSINNNILNYLDIKLKHYNSVYSEKEKKTLTKKIKIKEIIKKIMNLLISLIPSKKLKNILRNN